MKRLLVILFAVMLLGVTRMAQATIWTDSNYITSGGVGSVGYSYFTLDADSRTVIQTYTDNFDPYMYLFYDDGSLDSSDCIAFDDDSGVPSGYGWNNSLIDRTLTAGAYIVAVGDFYMSLSEAVSGINDPSSGGVGYGSYTLEVNALNANVTATAVPEPSTLILLSSGLLGLGYFGRKRMKG